jgi:hypothetical protein
MQDEKLNEIKRRIDVTYQGDRNLAVMLQDVIYLYKKLEESVPLDGLVMTQADYLKEIETAIENTVNEYDHILNMKRYPQVEDMEKWIRNLREAIQPF